MAKKPHDRIAVCAADYEGLLIDLASPDEKVRARAVRSVCPCRLGFPTFERCLKIVEGMQKDPSPEVRAQAQHVLEEAFQMSSSGRQTHPQMITNDMALAKFRSRALSLDEEDGAPPFHGDKTPRMRRRP